MPKTKAVKAQAPAVEADLGFLTDKQLAALGLDAESAAQTVQDASIIYAYVGRNPHCTRDKLIEYVNGRWGGGALDRLNAAVEFLTSQGKLIGS